MHLFFDLDNTLWDFDANSQLTLSGLFKTHGLDQKLSTDFDIFFEKYVAINDALWHLYYFKKIGKNELRYKRFYDAFLYFGYDDLVLSKKMAEDYLREAPYSKALKPGCIEVLEHLGKKAELHIITNGFAEVQNIKLDNCGLRPYFSQIIISEEHGLTKPDAGIFRLAEQMTGASAAESVMIGDNLVSDIDGAVGAGWRAVYYNYKNTAPSKHKVHHITHLRELTDLF
ncbi:MAG: YjjG family noncanonical pyrimidine nucleotidase [Bacteroidia bacterium]